MNHPTLPTLKEGEEFVCDNGCGVTEPEEFDFEYSREELPNGHAISKTVKAYRSKCCQGEICVFNEDVGFIPLDDYPQEQQA